MIQTKISILAVCRDGQQGIVKIEAVDEITNRDGSKNYTINDWLIDEDGNRKLINTKPYHYTVEKIDQVDSYIQANIDLTGLTKTQRDKKKVQIALFLDTTTNLLPIINKTVYMQNPDVWEMTEM